MDPYCLDCVRRRKACYSHGGGVDVRDALGAVLAVAWLGMFVACAVLATKGIATPYTWWAGIGVGAAFLAAVVRYSR